MWLCFWITGSGSIGTTFRLNLIQTCNNGESGGFVLKVRHVFLITRGRSFVCIMIRSSLQNVDAVKCWPVLCVGFSPQVIQLWKVIWGHWSNKEEVEQNSRVPLLCWKSILHRRSKHTLIRAICISWGREQTAIGCVWYCSSWSPETLICFLSHYLKVIICLSRGRTWAAGTHEIT